MSKTNDLTGGRFGSLTVLSRAENHVSAGGNVRSAWLCQCDCGNKTTVTGNNLLLGRVKSCGCLMKKNLPSSNLLGQRFGRLTVISEAEIYISPNGQRHRRWMCACDCGNTTIARAFSLKEGRTKSCGCLNQEMRVKSNTKHGKVYTRLYGIWSGMRGRCNKHSHKSYEFYGGRGITVCDEWNSDFQAFYDWAMNNGYDDGLSIDRIDVNGNYCPQNCRWATAKEQAQNRRPRKIKGK